MKQAMQQGGQHDSHHGQKGDATVERVKRGEQFAADGPHRIDRSHSSQNHGRVQ